MEGFFTIIAGILLIAVVAGIFFTMARILSSPPGNGKQRHSKSKRSDYGRRRIGSGHKSIGNQGK